MLTPQFILPMHPELVVDLFAGGGGASTGIEQAIGRHPDVAVNHDTEAVSLHTANHPQTRHFCSDVFEVDPITTPASGAADLPDAIHMAELLENPINVVCQKTAAAVLRHQHSELERLHALAAGQATAAQAVVPAGWKLVPLDATDEMVRATDEVNFENGDTDGTIHNVWHVMIAAAPAQPAAQQGAAYAELPERVVSTQEICDKFAFLEGAVTETCYWRIVNVADSIQTEALRVASHGQAPAETGNSVSARAGRVQEDAADPLQGAANWLAEAHGQFSPVVLSGCLMIGYNRAKRLHDAALAARKQGATP